MTNPESSSDTQGGCGCHGDREPATANLGQPTVGETPRTEDTSTGCCGSAQQSNDTPVQDTSAESADKGHGAEESTTGGSCCSGHGANNGEDTEASDAAASEAAAGDEQPAAEDSDSGCCSGHTKQPTVEEQLAEAIESQQRIAAEYANYRRRTERDRSTIAVVAKADVFAELLPVIDDLDLADKHGDLTGPLKAVNDKLRAAFAKHKVTQFGATGDEFNPDRHEAVQDASTSETKVVDAVLRPGFTIGDRLVRTAMVTIGDPQ